MIHKEDLLWLLRQRLDESIKIEISRPTGNTKYNTDISVRSPLIKNKDPEGPFYHNEYIFIETNCMSFNGQIIRVRQGCGGEPFDELRRGKNIIVSECKDWNEVADEVVKEIHNIWEIVAIF